MTKNNKFLDYTGLIQVFKLVKTEDKKLQDAINALKAQIGDWKVEDIQTVAAAVASLQDLVGDAEVAEQISDALDELDLAQVGGDSKYIKTVKQVDGKVTATVADLNTNAVANSSTEVDGATLTEALETLKDAIDSVESNAISVTAGNGIEITGSGEHTIAVKVKENDKYLTVGSDGVASQGIDNAITTAVNALKGEASTEGDTLKKIEERVKSVEDKVVDSTDVANTIKTEIEKLDADVTSTGGSKVTVKVVEEDGKVKTVTVTEADIASAATLASETAARKAVTGVNADAYAKHADATYIKDATSLDAADVALDTALDTVSTKVSALETKVGDESVVDAIQTEIAKLDSEVEGTGSIVTSVTQTDGKISGTKANLTSNDKTITVNGLDLAVNIDGTTIVKDSSTGKLSVASTALTMEGEDAIEVEDDETGKTVKLNIASGDKILTQSEAGLLANLELKYTKKTDTANGKIELIGKNNTVISTFDTGDFTVDGFLNSVAWKEDGSDILVFTWNTDAGKTATEINLSKYIDLYTADENSGINITDKKIKVVVPTDDKYLTVDGTGVHTKGIDDAISAEIAKINMTAMTDSDITTAFNAATVSSTVVPQE